MATLDSRSGKLERQYPPEVALNLIITFVSTDGTPDTRFRLLPSGIEPLEHTENSPIKATDQGSGS